MTNQIKFYNNPGRSDRQMTGSTDGGSNVWAHLATETALRHPRNPSSGEVEGPYPRLHRWQAGMGRLARAQESTTS
jgi:hypothetical protein